MKQYWNGLIKETEQAIRKLEPKSQEAYRIIATKKPQHIKQSQNHNNIYAKRQSHIADNIKQKLQIGKAMITRADKGRTTVIITIEEYNSKTLDFIHNNNFNPLNSNPTVKFQKNIKENLKQCNMIINKKQAIFLTQNKPRAPHLKAQIKLHKPGTPIRPVVNNINAPAHKLAKFLTKTFKEHITLPYQYNTINSITLAQELKQFKLITNHRLVTFDIKDLYVNIPTIETLQIPKIMLETQNKKIISQQILQLLSITLHQNYFTFDNKIYQPSSGTAMGSPLPNDITEIFLQHHEQRLLKHLFEHKTIEYYTRYVDDIFIIYNTEHTNIETINHYIKSIHPNLTFTPTQENHNSISFLDLQITRQHNTLDINIYRKPTTADTTINYYSNHRLEQKLVAYRYLINRMISLPLTKSNQNREWSNIKTIAQNNNFPIQLIHKLKKKK